jgi:hypothetical protein
MQKVVDFQSQGGGPIGNLAHGFLHLIRCFTGLPRHLIDDRGVAVDVLGAVRGLLNVEANLGGRRALLLDGCCDDRPDLADFSGRVANPLDRRHRVTRGVLDGTDLGRELLGRLTGLVGQGLDLRGDQGEAFADLAVAGRLDRGVERQEVGLRGNIANYSDDLADLLRRRCQSGDQAVGLFGLANGRFGDFHRFYYMIADLGDRAGQLFRRGSDGVDIGRGLVRSGCHRRGLAGGILGGRLTWTAPCHASPRLLR